MNSDLKRYLPLLTRILIVILTVISIYFLSTTLLIYLLPFIFGWMIATIMQPIVSFFSVRCKLPRSISTFLAMTVFVVFTGLIIALIGGIIVLQLTKLSDMLPSYSNKFYQQSNDLVNHVQKLFIQLPPDIAQTIINGLNSLSDKLTTLLGFLVSSLLSFLTAIPGIFLFIIVTILSAYFMARDRRKILRFMIAQVPAKTLSKGKTLRHDLLLALIGYIKAQFILMTITFVESSIGLTLIGIDYSILFALAASIIDALPILGTGSVYIPLMLWKLSMGHYRTAMLLGGLYGIIVMVRQLLEPKILGSQIGIYPLVTLMAMYMGLKLFGFLGLIIGPVCVIIFMTLQKVNILPNWRK